MKTINHIHLKIHKEFSTIIIQNIDNENENLIINFEKKNNFLNKFKKKMNRFLEETK